MLILCMIGKYADRIGEETGTDAGIRNEYIMKHRGITLSFRALWNSTDALQAVRAVIRRILIISALDVNGTSERGEERKCRGTLTHVSKREWTRRGELQRIGVAERIIDWCGVTR